MPANREMLEGEAYWGRIKSIKRKLYALEFALMIVMAVILTVTSAEFSFNPFLFPLDKLLGFILVMIIVLLAESIFFRVMQIRIARSDSTRYIMATNSIRRAMIIAIIAAIIAALLLLPGMTSNIESSLSTRGTATYDEPGRFQNKDPVSLSSVDSVTIHSSKPAKVYLVSQFMVDTYLFGNYSKDVLKVHALNSKILANPDVQIDMTPYGFDTYYIYVWGANSSGDANATAEYTLHTTLSDSVKTLVPIVAIVMLISNAVWIEYLVPLRKKCKCKSIYK